MFFNGINFLDYLKIVNLRTFSSATEGNKAATGTPQPISKSEVQSRAQGLLAMLPGETAFSKTAYATIGAGLGAFLISKGIYVPNDETLVLVAFAITIRALYNKLSGPVSEYLENSINEMREKWLASSVSEKEKIISSISEMEGFRDHTDVTTSFYSTRHENIILDAELTALKDQYRFFSNIKQRLDETVRKEKDRATEERRAKVEALINGINAALKDPKMQETILKKCISDLEKMEAKQMA